MRERGDLMAKKLAGEEALKALKEELEGAIARVAYDDAPLKADVKANGQAIAVLNGGKDTPGSVAHTAAQAAAEMERAQVVDDLTTGGADKALSAEQGKRLGELSNLTNCQRALSNLGAGVRPTLLDNPGLDINQQGLSIYDTSKAAKYTVDRWWNIFGNYDVNSKALTSVGETYGAAFRQAVSNPKWLAGQKVTVTAWILSGKGNLALIKATGINSGQVSIHSIPIDGGGLYSFTAEVPSDVGGEGFPYLTFSISLALSGSMQFAPVIPFKLEFGEGQTLAYQDADGAWQLLPQPDMDYATQLFQCRRYQQMIESAVPHSAQYININFIDFAVPLSFPMRAAPVIEGNNLSVRNGAGEAQTGFTFSVLRYTGDSVLIRATKDGHGFSYSDGPHLISVGANTLLSANL